MCCSCVRVNLCWALTALCPLGGVLGQSHYPGPHRLRGLLHVRRCHGDRQGSNPLHRAAHTAGRPGYMVMLRCVHGLASFAGVHTLSDVLLLECPTSILTSHGVCIRSLSTLTSAVTVHRYDKIPLPSADALFKREKYSLQPDWVVFACPQSTFKIHPDFDVEAARFVGCPTFARACLNDSSVNSDGSLSACPTHSCQVQFVVNNWTDVRPSCVHEWCRLCRLSTRFGL